jgi:hypothetical protein
MKKAKKYLFAAAAGGFVLVCAAVLSTSSSTPNPGHECSGTGDGHDLYRARRCKRVNLSFDTSCKQPIYTAITLEVCE